MIWYLSLECLHLVLLAHFTHFSMSRKPLFIAFIANSFLSGLFNNSRGRDVLRSVGNKLHLSFHRQMLLLLENRPFWGLSLFQSPSQPNGFLQIRRLMTLDIMLYAVSEAKYETIHVIRIRQSWVISSHKVHAVFKL
uniref:Uncharacterized protein n=1 Tax=Triticum urartu TaxID=4572 RepID=A0A8R7JYI9_TRIUA